jgi:hypothetical protein
MKVTLGSCLVKVQVKDQEQSNISRAALGKQTEEGSSGSAGG